jgi:hypothetical protein
MSFTRFDSDAQQLVRRCRLSIQLYTHASFPEPKQASDLKFLPLSVKPMA